MNPTFFSLNSTGAPGSPGGGGGGGESEAVALEDDFDRANSSSLGADWTEVVGSMSISGSFLLFNSGSFSSNLAMNTTPVGVTTQYQRCTFSFGTGSIIFSFVFRATSNTGAGYAINLMPGNNEIEWFRYSNVATGAGSQQIGGTSVITISNGDTFGVTVDGLGDNTIVRVWRNPTGLPSAANNWNGDTTPNLTLTSNPTTPADTGTLLGVYALMENSADCAINDWFGGSL